MTATRQEGVAAAGLRMFRPRPTLPVVEALRVELTQAERDRVEKYSARLRAAEPALGSTRHFGPWVQPGLLARAPAVLFEDYGGVALFTGIGPDYRSLALAGDDDTVVIAVPHVPAFEDYCRRHLGLGRAEVHRLPPPPPGPVPSLAVRCLDDDALMKRVVATARTEGGLNLIPYMGNGYVWKLAAEIAARSGAEVRVAAPPPRLAKQVNDKLWFSRRLVELLGRDALPLTHHAFGPAALAARIKALAARHPRLFIKVPDSAGSAGNLVFESATVARQSLAGLRAHLIELLEGRGWRGRFPLAVGVWEGPVLDNPSVQFWVPLAEEGPPVIEGVFSQRLAGAAGSFVGAEPNTLPEAVQERLAREAFLFASLFQSLGYFGQCSFDALLAGETLDDARVHWVECNGRWGGVSIPMTLANRLVGDWRRRPPFMFRVLAPEGRLFEAFPEVLAGLEGRLFRPGAGETGIVVVAPSRTILGEGLYLMALAETAAAARQMAQDAAASLGLPIAS